MDVQLNKILCEIIKNVPRYIIKLVVIYSSLWKRNIFLETLIAGSVYFDNTKTLSERLIYFTNTHAGEIN